MIEREHNPEDEDHVRKVLGIMEPTEPTLLRPAPLKSSDRTRFKREPEDDRSFQSFERMMRSNRGVEY